MRVRDSWALVVLLSAILGQERYASRFPVAEVPFPKCLGLETVFSVRRKTVARAFMSLHNNIAIPLRMRE